MRKRTVVAVSVAVALCAACTYVTEYVQEPAPQEQNPRTLFATSCGDAASDAQNDAATDTGSDVASDTGADTGSDAVADTGSDAVADSGSDTGSDTGVDAGSDGGRCGGGTPTIDAHAGVEREYGAGGGTMTTSGVTTTSGDALVLFVSGEGCANLGVSDSKGNSYVEVGTFQAFAGDSGCTMGNEQGCFYTWVYAAVGATVGGASHTFSYRQASCGSGGGEADLLAVAVKGAAGIDAFVQQRVTSYAPIAPSPGVVTSCPNDLVLAFDEDNSNLGGTETYAASAKDVTTSAGLTATVLDGDTHKIDLSMGGADSWFYAATSGDTFTGGTTDSLCNPCSQNDNSAWLVALHP